MNRQQRRAAQRSRPAAPKPGGVLFAYPCGGYPEPEFVRSLVAFLRYDAAHAGHVIEHGDWSALVTTNVSNGRNKIARRFLDTNLEWLWFVDDDMTFEPDTLDRMLAAANELDAKIISALCFARVGDGEIVPTFCGIQEVDGALRLVRPSTYPVEQPFQVGVVGTGCMLIHRTVLEALEARWRGPWPWFDYMPQGEDDHIGEDYTFCLRAGSPVGNKPGVGDDGETFSIWVDGRIKCGHVKRFTVQESTFWKTTPAAPLLPPTFVVIPVKGQHAYTEAVLHQLAEQGEYTSIFVYDNGVDTDPYTGYRPDNCDVIPAAGRSIHQMWNDGIRRATSLAQVCNIAILNNDLELGPRFLSGLAAALRSQESLFAVSPNYDRRTFDADILGVRGIAAGYENGTGGLAGFAFMVKGELYSAGFPYFDEDYEIWFGDNDFTMEVERHGGQLGIVRDTTVVHIDGGSKTAGDGRSRLGTPELKAAAARDRARFTKKWNVTLR